MSTRLYSKDSLAHRLMIFHELNTRLHPCLGLLALVLVGAGALAQETGGDGQRKDERLLGGPDGVSQKLREQENAEAAYEFHYFQDRAKPYLDWKKKLKEEHGLAFGLSAYVLYQKASQSTTEDDALGGLYRFQGTWNAFARDSGHPGRLEWRLEHRSEIGGFQAPNQLSAGVGATGNNTGFGYSEGFDTDLGVISWVQGFNDQKAGIAVGRLAFDVYQDAFLFQTFSRGFLNRAFLVNPTIGTTGVGALGAVAKGFVNDNFWIGGQIYDGNAVSGKWSLDTFNEHEWLKSVEVGWTPSIDTYKVNRIQFTYWEKDARAKAGASEGQGWAVSSSMQLNDKVIPFLRFGHSSGGAGVPAESAASVGFEYKVKPHGILSFGAGWAKPSRETYGPGLDDEYVVETSYKVQLSPNFSLMPDLQLLADPATNPTEDRLWVLGLRAILSI